MKFLDEVKQLHDTCEVMNIAKSSGLHKKYSSVKINVLSLSFYKLYP